MDDGGFLALSVGVILLVLYAYLAGDPLHGATLAMWFSAVVLGRAYLNGGQAHG